MADNRAITTTPPPMPMPTPSLPLWLAKLGFCAGEVWVADAVVELVVCKEVVEDGTAEDGLDGVEVELLREINDVELDVERIDGAGLRPAIEL